MTERLLNVSANPKMSQFHPGKNSRVNLKLSY